MYAHPSQSGKVSLNATIIGAGIKFVEWKFNGTGVRQGQDEITLSVTKEAPTVRIASLNISRYIPMTHLGTYELLATSEAGTAVVASWILRNAGVWLGEMGQFKIKLPLIILSALCVYVLTMSTLL